MPIFFTKLHRFSFNNSVSLFLISAKAWTWALGVLEQFLYVSWRSQSLGKLILLEAWISLWTSDKPKCHCFQKVEEANNKGQLLQKEIQLSCAGMNTVLCPCLIFYMDETLFLTSTPFSMLEVEPVLCVFRGMMHHCAEEREWEGKKLIQASSLIFLHVLSLRSCCLNSLDLDMFQSS